MLIYSLVLLILTLLLTDEFAIPFNDYYTFSLTWDCPRQAKNKMLFLFYCTLLPFDLAMLNEMGYNVKNGKSVLCSIYKTNKHMVHILISHFTTICKTDLGMIVFYHGRRSKRRKNTWLRLKLDCIC